MARENYNMSGDQNAKEIYENERKNCKRVLQRKKNMFSKCNSARSKEK